MKHLFISCGMLTILGSFFRGGLGQDLEDSRMRSSGPRFSRQAPRPQDLWLSLFHLYIYWVVLMKVIGLFLSPTSAVCCQDFKIDLRHVSFDLLTFSQAMVLCPWLFKLSSLLLLLQYLSTVLYCTTLDTVGYHGLTYLQYRESVITAINLQITSIVS